MMKLLRGFRCAADGNIAVEFALVVPILMILALGTFDGARIFLAQLHLINAAQAGAQYGMRDMLTASDSEGMVRTALADAADMPIEVRARQFCACAIEVACGSYCTPDQVAPYYVEVSTIADVRLLFGFPGLENPVRLAGSRVVRVN